MDGEAANDEFGISVSLSADGTIVAACGLFNDGNGSASGHVRVYKNNRSNRMLQQLGQDLDGEAAGDYFGTSVSLSADGKLQVVFSMMTKAIFQVMLEYTSTKVASSCGNSLVKTWMEKLQVISLVDQYLFLQMEMSWRLVAMEMMEMGATLAMFVRTGTIVAITCGNRLVKT